VLIGLEMGYTYVGSEGQFIDGENDRQDFLTDWYSTLQVRAGLIFGNLLAYLSAGGHYTESNLHVEGDTGQEDFDSFGGAFGGGLEYMINNNLSMRVDGQYLLINDSSENLTNLPDGDSGDF
jgi:opacity protein-like surface antigen